MCDLVHHAVLGIVSHFLGRPLALWRFFQIFTPGLAANGGALQNTVRGVCFGLVACPFAFAFCAHVLASALAPGFVGTGTEQGNASCHGEGEIFWCWKS